MEISILKVGYKLMTANSRIKQLDQRMEELFAIARQRYLAAGGNPRKPVDCNQWLTEAEQEEFLRLSRQVISDEAIANYLGTKRTNTENE